MVFCTKMTSPDEKLRCQSHKTVNTYFEQVSAAQHVLIPHVRRDYEC